MKKEIIQGLIYVNVSCFFLIPPHVRADANIYWDFDDGFSPGTVQISPGETVTWWNYDLYGFPVEITVGGSLTFTLTIFTGQGVIFPYAGIYGFSSNWGEYGSVIVIPPTPAGITLESPRSESGQFLFDATGLTVGKTNIVEASTNLLSWTAIQTNVAAAASMSFTNAITLPCQFFRLTELP